MQSEVRRVAIVQRALAPYRLPLYRALDALPDWSVRVVHGPVMGPAPARAFELSHQLVNAAAGPLTWQRGVIAALREIRPDVVVLGANPWVLSNQAVLRWCMQHEAACFLWGLGFAPGRRSPIRRALHPVGRGLLTLQLASAAGVLAYSEHAAGVYRALAPRAIPIHVVGNASIDNRGVVRPKPPGHRLIFVGRLTPEKRVDALIDALGLPLGDPRWRLDIVGSGSQEAALRRRVADRELRQVTFHGHQPQVEVQRLMRRAHFLVLPGRGGLVVQEALARGLPVIALSGRCGGGDGTLDDLLSETIAGELVGSRSPSALRAAIAAGFADQDWADRQRAALEAAQRHGGLNAVVTRFREALLGVAT